MRISEAYPSKYLKAADLDGQDRTVSIRACVQEELGQGSEMEVKPVLYFDGGPKGLVLISNLFGRNRGSNDIDRALRHIKGAGLANCVSESTAGRTVERWIAQRNGA